jgi:hypothetical protein
VRYDRTDRSRRIDASFEELEAAREYVMHLTLQAWCTRNDFVAPLPAPLWVVQLPVGYVEDDSLFEVAPMGVFLRERLRLIPEWDATFQKNRATLALWLRQTRRI